MGLLGEDDGRFNFASGFEADAAVDGLVDQVVGVVEVAGAGVKTHGVEVSGDEIVLSG